MGEQNRRAPWEDEFPFRAGPLRWATDSSFWRNIAMAVISTAIIGAFATYFLAIAIYSKYGPNEGVIGVNMLFTILIIAGSGTVAFLYAYREGLRESKAGKYHLVAILPALTGLVTLWCIWVVSQLFVANLINTIEFKPAPIEEVLPSLLLGQQSTEDVPFAPTNTRSS